MRLSGFIQRTRALGDTEIPTHELDAIGEMIAAGADLGAVLKKRSNALTPRVLLGTWRAARRYQAHVAWLDQVAERRRQKGLQPIPPALLLQTTAAHEVAVLERAFEMTPSGRVAEHRRRDALKEALALWSACLVLTRKLGQINIELITEDEALRARYGELAGTTTMGELGPDRWLAIRQGEHEGALEMTVDVPLQRLVDQVSARGAELAAVASGRNAEELLRELVLVDLDEWAIVLKDDEARLLTLRDIGHAYHELLCSTRSTHQVVAGVWPAADGRLGVAVVLKDGRAVAHDVVEPGENPVAAVEAFLGGHLVEAVALPEATADAALLERLAEGLGGGAMQVVRVSGEAMEAALEGTEETGAPEGLSAVVLARRAVRPIKYWGLLDPLALPLAQRPELDPDEIRSALDEVRALARAGVKPEDLARPTQGAGAGRPKTPPKPLNPAVKSVDDLRPGMQVNGVVTNITQFGAFVNIGLSHEGLVHVSELADHFVNDPKDVVSVNQEVSARVLGVDRARRRISLSLRAERPVGPRREANGEVGEDGKQRILLDDIPGGRGGGRRSGFGGDRPRQGASGHSRSQALADLEALFKKK